MSLVPEFKIGLWNAWTLMVYYLIVRQYLSAIREERLCLEKYGNAYREYIKRTPRYIGVPRR